MQQPKPVRIWDLHTHIGALGGRTADEMMARNIEMADRMGVERLVLFMGTPMVVDPSADELRRQNDQVLQALSHWHHRAFGFVYVSPNHVEASLKEIERCVRDGPMVGLKLWVAGRCADERIDPLIAVATQLKAVVFQHTWIKTQGNLGGESTPEDVVKLAARHPKASIICGHTGGNWTRGIRAVRATPNVTIDTGGSDPTSGFVEMAVRELGANRILYGSDIAGRSFASQLAKVTGASISDADKRLILGENLRRLLLPILQSKGVRA